jgi:radical SAM protein with 4Fe4S-binding SPASM domain
MGEAGVNFDSIVPRISLVSPYLKKSMEIGKHFGVKVMTEAVPPCFLKGMEDHVSENIMPRTKIFELDSVTNDYEKVRINEAKSKGPNCKKCKLNYYCEGSWKEYPEKFGWEEFCPVKKEFHGKIRLKIQR